MQLSRFAGARLILGAARAIDPVNKLIHVEGRGQIAYDVASIDIGIHAEMPYIPGFAQHATGAKPLDQYAARWRTFLARVSSGEVEPDVAVIGGGVAGMELALAMAHALQGAVGGSRVSVIEVGPEIAGRNRPTAALWHVPHRLLGRGTPEYNGQRSLRASVRLTMALCAKPIHGWRSGALRMVGCLKANCR